MASTAIRLSIFILLHALPQANALNNGVAKLPGELRVHIYVQS